MSASTSRTRDSALTTTIKAEVSSIKEAIKISNKPSIKEHKANSSNRISSLMPSTEVVATLNSSQGCLQTHTWAANSSTSKLIHSSNSMEAGTSSRTEVVTIIHNGASSSNSRMGRVGRARGACPHEADITKTALVAKIIGSKAWTTMQIITTTGDDEESLADRLC